MIGLREIETAAELVYQHLPPTPQYRWPLLSARVGAEVWVKHENHTPIGAFKVRGGLTYMADLKARQPDVPGVITATRGNHGQSVAYAARAHGIRAVVVVPHGNSVEKNRAMRAFGAELVEHGRDFNAAYDHAQALAARDGLHLLPSYHPLLASGVGTYSLEFLRAVPDLDTVYVPIGLGSGITGMIAARDGLNAKTEIVGVVSENAATYALSVAAGKPVPTDSAETMADGLAVRVPNPDAVGVIAVGAARVVTISDGEIAAAMRAYFADTHNVAEGAGAAPLAALLREKDRMAGRTVGLILSGGNVDTNIFQDILAGSS